MHFDAICEHLLFIHLEYKIYEEALTKPPTHMHTTIHTDMNNMPHGDIIIMFAFMQSTSGQQMHIHSNISYQMFGHIGHFSV